jgi:hypothetical protein
MSAMMHAMLCGLGETAPQRSIPSLTDQEIPFGKQTVPSIARGSPFCLCLCSLGVVSTIEGHTVTVYLLENMKVSQFISEQETRASLSESCTVAFYMILCLMGVPLPVIVRPGFQIFFIKRLCFRDRIFLLRMFLFHLFYRIVKFFTVEIGYIPQVVEWVLLEHSLWVRLEEARIEKYAPILRRLNLGSLNLKFFEVFKRQEESFAFFDSYIDGTENAIVSWFFGIHNRSHNGGYICVVGSAFKEDDQSQKVCLGMKVKCDSVCTKLKRRSKMESGCFKNLSEYVPS